MYKDDPEEPWILLFPESIRGQNLHQDYESPEFVLGFLYRMEILFSRIAVGPSEPREIFVLA